MVECEHAGAKGRFTVTQCGGSGTKRERGEGGKERGERERERKEVRARESESEIFKLPPPLLPPPLY